MLYRFLGRTYSSSPKNLSPYAERLARLCVPGALVIAGVLHHERTFKRHLHAWTRTANAKTKLQANDESTQQHKDDKQQSSAEDSFDLTKTLNKFSEATEEWKERLLGTKETDREHGDDKGPSITEEDDESRGFLDSIKSFLGGDGNDSKSSSSSSSTKKDSGESVFGMGQELMMLMSSTGSNSSIDDVVKQVRDMSGRGDVQDQADVMEVFNVAKKCAAMLDVKLGGFFGEEGMPPLYLTNLMYFVEREDELKNASWKRRTHRFFPGIDMSRLDDCYEKMLLAWLGYEDSVETIRETLKKNYNSELVYCSTISKPNMPAHFVAVKRDQSRWSNEIEVLVVICGTKSVTDVITDLLCDTAPYRGGLAHAGITESGKWLVDLHKDLFGKLRELTNKNIIKLSVVGHSLGAGTATIAGIEWNDDPNIDVKVIGFGCPALVSKDISQEVEKFVTTIVADSDCVPRMSMASMVNALMEVTELDITGYAKRDFQQTVDELQRFLPSLVDDAIKNKILENLHGLLPDPPNVDSRNKKRMTVELFPPGKIIHFFRDGYGITGSVTPSTYFDEIEVSRRLLDDHFFDKGYQRMILDLMRQYHNDNFFTFEQKWKGKDG